jgi:hypothetical protein
LERLAGGAEHPVTLVDELYVFGSFARGALEPHDVDLAVEYTGDDEYRGRQIWLMSRSRNPNTDLRAALAGRSRGLQFQFGNLENLHADGIATTLLWRRGDTLKTALDRLAAIKPDPDAGRAPRDEMHPAFAGIDQWVPRAASCANRLLGAVTREGTVGRKLPHRGPITNQDPASRWRGSASDDPNPQVNRMVGCPTSVGRVGLEPTAQGL